MNQQFYVVVNQVTVFGILMVIGFIMAKLDVLSSDVLNGLSKIIVKLLLPCLIAYLILGNGVTIQMILAHKSFGLALLLMYAFLCVLGYIMASASGLRKSGQDMFAVATMFCNIGFMGVPLIQSMFPGNVEVATCLSIYSVIDQFLLWSVGLFLVTRHSKQKGSVNALLNIMNPMTVGIMLSLAVLYFNISLPAPLLNTIDGLGTCSRYLALLYLGGLLAAQPIVRLLTRPYVYLEIVLKMVVAPLATYIVAGMFFHHAIALTLATIISLPPMVATTMMARTYGGEEHVAVEVVFVSTIACLGTIPLVQYLIGMLF